ncbi:MAG: Hydroxymethylpyrimidine ABC transporter, transmembrane component, partial [uncultured Solirubrobacteraceae bacterium]
ARRPPRRRPARRLGALRRLGPGGRAHPPRPERRGRLPVGGPRAAVGELHRHRAGHRDRAGARRRRRGPRRRGAPRVADPAPGAVARAARLPDDPDRPHRAAARRVVRVRPAPPPGHRRARLLLPRGRGDGGRPGLRGPRGAQAPALLRRLPPPGPALPRASRRPALPLHGRAAGRGRRGDRRGARRDGRRRGAPRRPGAHHRRQHRPARDRARLRGGRRPHPLRPRPVRGARARRAPAAPVGLPTPRTPHV